jgi:hypothetical protein
MRGGGGEAAFSVIELVAVRRSGDAAVNRAKQSKQSKQSEAWVHAGMFGTCV